MTVSKQDATSFAMPAKMIKTSVCKPNYWRLSFKINQAMNENDINDYIPSILNPRSMKKERGDITLTQVVTFYLLY